VRLHASLNKNSCSPCYSLPTTLALMLPSGNILVRLSSMWYSRSAPPHLSWEIPLKSYPCAPISEGPPAQPGRPTLLGLIHALIAGTVSAWLRCRPVASYFYPVTAFP
jgi:hypothetical protein